MPTELLPTNEIDVDDDGAELIEAMNDPDKAKLLMERKGWDANELLIKAESFARELSDRISSVNVV